MKRRRKAIPIGSVLPVRLTQRDVLDIREQTFANQEYMRAGVVEGDGTLRFDWSLEDIEIIQGYVAASANHTKDRRLRKRLDLIYLKLAVFLDGYVEKPDSS